MITTQVGKLPDGFAVRLGGRVRRVHLGFLRPERRCVLGGELLHAVAGAGALSSSAFVLPVLKQKGWDERPDGIAALAVLLLQDLLVAPLLVILPLVAGSGPQSTGELGVLVAKATVRPQSELEPRTGGVVF
mgnify:CR=1 FL=1